MYDTQNQTPNYNSLVEKWASVLNEESATSITDYHKKSVTAVLLENQERAINEEAAMINEGTGTTSNNTTSASNWNPILISLVRRAMPNLVAYDICGVQPMTGPTGLIFAMKSRYGDGATSSTEALFNEANTLYSGDSSATAQDASSIRSFRSYGLQLGFQHRQ